MESPKPAELRSEPFPAVRYCRRCCFPETVESIVFDEMGICRSCRSSEEKIHIDWVEREQELRRILEDARARAGDSYDCIIPISGGKDSTFQLHVLTKVYGMRPLAVTFNHNWYSRIGWYNLMNALEQFQVDHMMFTPNRGLVNRLARKSLGAIGDACWHCHSGVGAFPLHVAQKFGIRLLVWGESIADSSGKASHKEPGIKFDRDYFVRVSAKRTRDEMVGDDISRAELALFEPPTAEECEAAGVWGIHLGDYVFWDDERQTEFVRDHYGWKECEMEGAYKGYKSNECIMQGVHDFTCYLKRGFGRATWQASIDVRNGLLTREEGMELIKQNDPQVPEALEYYLHITGLSDEEFYATMKQARSEALRSETLPIIPRQTPCTERKNLTFVEQFIKEVRSESDPRGSDEPAFP